MIENTTVLLIGGSSGVGKTVVASRLASQLGMTWASVDDFRLVLQRMSTPDAQPALHTFFRTLSHRSAEELAHTYIEVAHIVSYALEIVIANHVATAVPLILEGDTILPELAAKHVFADLPIGNQVCSVFLVESDEATIMHNVLERGRGVEQLSSEQLNTHVRFSWLYGQWIEREAHKYGLAVIPAQPHETVVRRILETLQSTKLF
jgi:2-phosphoglycerate kinase